MNSEMTTVISILTQRIENLQQIKRMLLDEFGPSGAGVLASQKPTKKASSNGAASNGNGTTRKTQLIKFLTTHGPARRGEIAAETKMPEGTIANLLTKDEFVRRNDGKWDVREASKLSAAVWTPPAEKGIQ